MTGGRDAALPGALRTRVALEARSETADGAGGTTLVWTVTAMLWANIAPAGADETYRADGLRQDVSHVITLRYRQDVVPGMRFRAGARIFEIRTVLDPDERRIRLHCGCRELS